MENKNQTENKNQNVISVIVPVYKVEDYLDECVQSIVDQSYSHLEIILVDDGSPDSCPQRCDEWANKDDRIQVIHQENAGLSEARNSGLKIATGEYVLFVDSDDWLDLSLCEKVITCLEEEGADVAVFGYAMIDDGTKEVLEMKKMTKEVVDATTGINMLLSTTIDNYAWNKIYKRHLFDDVKYPASYLWEDIGTTYKVFEKTSRIAVMEESYYFYRQRQTNITGTIGIKGLQDIFLLRLEQYKYLRKVAGVNAELGFDQLVENAFLFYNRALTENCDEKNKRRVIHFLEKNEMKIKKTNLNKKFRLFYKNRMLYDLKIRFRAVGKKILKGKKK